MKVLYVGKFTPRHHSDIYIANAMERSGWNVIRVDCCTLGKKTKSIALQILQTTKLHMLFTGKQRVLDESFYNVAKSKKIPVVIWFGDQRGTPSPTWVIKLARSADWFLPTNSGQLSYFKSVGAHNVAFWPLAAEPSIFKPMEVTKQDVSLYRTDVAFTGSNYGKRFPNSGDRLSLIRNLAKHVSVRTYGKGWENKYKLVSMAPALLEDCAKVLSCAKTSLGINNYFEVRQYQSHRTWTNMSCGSCFLNRYEPGLEDIFKDHEHLVFWRTPEELVAVANEYCTNKKRRKAIQLAARQFILSAHTFDHRIELLKLFLLRKRSGIVWDQRIES